MVVPQFAVSMTWTLLCVALLLASAFRKLPIYCMYIAIALYAIGILVISAVYSGVVVCCCCRRLSEEVEAAAQSAPPQPQSKESLRAAKKQDDRENPSTSSEDHDEVQYAV